MYKGEYARQTHLKTPDDPRKGISMTEKITGPYLECGRIINTHGVRGGLKAEPWSDKPADICRLPRLFMGKGAQKTEYRVLRASVLQGRFLLLELEGITDMDKAAALRGQTLYALRADIPLREGQYFLSDAVGLPALDARPGREGQLLGKVTAVDDGAASPIFTVTTARGQVLIPAVPAFIKAVVPGDHVSIEPIDGMFENADDEILPGDPVSDGGAENGGN